MADRPGEVRARDDLIKNGNTIMLWTAQLPSLPQAAPISLRNTSFEGGRLHHDLLDGEPLRLGALNSATSVFSIRAEKMRSRSAPLHIGDVRNSHSAAASSGWPPGAVVSAIRWLRWPPTARSARLVYPAR